MKRLTLLMLALSLVTHLAFASGSNAPNRTGEYLNGRWWRSMNSVGRANYLLGLMDGYQFSGYNNGKAESLRELMGSTVGKVTNLEILEQIDLVYSDSANLIVPI